MPPHRATTLLLGILVACDRRAVTTGAGRSSTSSESSGHLAEHLPEPAASFSLNLSWPERPARLGKVTLESDEVIAGECSNAPKVVAGLITGMRACYGRGLEEDRTQRGELTVRLQIGAEGEVTSSSFEGGVPFTPETLECISTRLGMATFARPEGTSAAILF